MVTRLETNDQHLTLQSNDTEDVPNTVPNNWQMWCRLCAKEDPEGNVHVLLKNEPAQAATFISGENEYVSGDGRTNENLCLVDFVEKHFCVQITSDDPLPKMLCTDCFSLVTSLVSFSKRVAKVQQMFLSMKDSSQGSEVDTHIVRLKYGLLDEEPGKIFPHKMQTEVHYLEANINKKTEEYTPDEVPIVNPLDLLNPLEPHMETKVQTANQSTVIRTEDYKQDNSDDDDRHSVEKHEHGLSLRNDISQSSDSEHLNDASNAECKRELRNIKKHNIKPNLRKKRQCIYIERDESDSNKNECSETDDEVLRCTECPRKFKDIKGLRRHMIQVHSKRLPLVNVSCSKCPLVFKSESQRKKHFKTHMSEKEKLALSCTYCDKKFGRKSSLQTHIKHVHNDERPYVCEKCGAERHTLFTLKEHMLTHTDYRLFKCEFCQKQFTTKNHLKRHLDIHDSIKHICTICGMQLNTRINLRCHMRVHSNETPHKCDYCGRAFKRTSNFKHHLISHTGIKPYCCNFCDRTFSCAVNCRLHIKKIHPEEATAAGKLYTLNMPKLEVLKTFSKTADNLLPVPSGPLCKKEAKKMKDT